MLRAVSIKSRNWVKAPVTKIVSHDADVEVLEELAQQLRVDSIRASAAAGSGHPTSSMSAAELMAVLIAKYLRYDFENPENRLNDRLIFSKGHASPLLYSLYKAVGAIDDDELLTFRTSGSRLEGHPTPALPWVDVATGSLGQGLPIGVGMAIAGKYLDCLDYNIWVLCGDSEMAEGSMWEAFEHAAFERLDNLIAIIDVNRLGQRGETMHGWDTGSYVRRAEAVDWLAIELDDGHDVAAIDEAFAAAAAHRGGPVVVVARTMKGKGVSAVENRHGFHGKPLENPEEAVHELGGLRDLRVEVIGPSERQAPAPPRPPRSQNESACWSVGDEVATRTAYGKALAAIGASRGNVVALDGEVSDSTRAAYFKEACPERFFEMYIAEQQLVAAAVGIQSRGWIPFASTFAAFLTRASDFIRMAAISRADLRLVGSHAGVSIGADGPSQMGLEDLAMFRAVHGSAVLCPSDANQTARLVEAMAERGGITYLRTTRPETPVLYEPDEEFSIGGSHVLGASPEDAVAIVAAGITVYEARKAARMLEKEDISARIIDLYSIKPLDAATLLEAAEVTDGRLVTVEDHWPEGGLGDAVLEVFASGELPVRIRKLAVREMPGSGPPNVLLSQAGIDSHHIAQAARLLVRPHEPVGVL